MDKPTAVTVSVVAICAAVIFAFLMGAAVLGCQQNGLNERSRHTSLVERCKILAEKNLPCTSW